MAISETFGILFKTHKDQCKLLVETLFGQLLPDYLSEGKPDIKKKFALFVIVDLIEHLGLDRIEESQFKGCFQTLALHSQHPSPVLRQACCYGFGIIAQVGGSVFGQYAQEIINLLIQAIQIPKGSQDEELYVHCKDNAISSLGKILKYQGSSIPNA